jgi:hypothetical protein
MTRANPRGTTTWPFSPSTPTRATATNVTSNMTTVPTAQARAGPELERCTPMAPAWATTTMSASTRHSCQSHHPKNTTLARSSQAFHSMGHGRRSQAPTKAMAKKTAKPRVVNCTAAASL